MEYDLNTSYILTGRRRSGKTTQLVNRCSMVASYVPSSDILIFVSNLVKRNNLLELLTEKLEGLLDTVSTTQSILKLANNSKITIKTVDGNIDSSRGLNPSHIMIDDFDVGFFDSSFSNRFLTVFRINPCSRVYNI
jgi:AAA+ ATPase superfamily predicted ATPase